MFEGSIPSDAVADVSVELSCIKYPAADAILTETLATFLMVISLPAPNDTAEGIVIVCEAVEPVNII